MAIPFFKEIKIGSYLVKQKLRVMVGIFGRATPVEVDFHQVEKV